MDFPEEDIFLPKGCMKLYFRPLAVGDIENGPDQTTH